MAGTTVKITLDNNAGSFDAYLASPPKGRGPGLVVIQEIFGVNKVMRDLCDGFAAQGFFAICPDLFWRQKPGVDITDQTDAEWQQAFALYKGFNVDSGIADIAVTIEQLKPMKGVAERVGAVGYCLGGLLAYLTAARTRADACVGYYGVGIENHLGEAKKIAKPLMLHIAEKDDFCKPDAQAKIKAGLGGMKNVELHSYTGMQHAFAREGGKHFDRAAASFANSRTNKFFKDNLT